MSNTISASGYDGDHCPNCTSGSIEGDLLEPCGSTSAYRRVWCKDCDAVWTETFHLSSTVELELPADED